MKQADFVEIFLFPKNYRVQIIRNEIIEADFNSDFINRFFFSFPMQTPMSKNNYHPYELLIGRLRFCVALYRGFASYLNSSP